MRQQTRLPSARSAREALWLRQHAAVPLTVRNTLVNFVIWPLRSAIGSLVSVPPGVVRPWVYECRQSVPSTVPGLSAVAELELCTFRTHSLMFMTTNRQLGLRNYTIRSQYWEPITSETMLAGCG